MDQGTLAKFAHSPWTYVVVILAALLLWEVGKKYVPTGVGWLAKQLVGVLAGTKLMRGRALRIYRERVATRYARLAVLFMPGESLDVSTIYVPLQATDVSGGQPDDAYERIRSTEHVVVLGAPGAGKSMLLRHSILTWARGPRSRGGRVPVLLELRRCNGNTSTLEELIIERFGVDGFAKADRFVHRSLREGGLSLLFDGLDEVGTAERGRVTRLLQDFAASYPKCQIVVTCRTAIYNRTLLPEFTAIFHVASFDERHIRRFLRQWPGITEQIEMERLFTALRNTPRLMQLAGNPLLLTMIAYLYGGPRNRDRILPHSRAEFYRKATEELLDRLKHEANRFEGPKKKAVLKQLALAAQDTPATAADRRALRYDTVIAEVKKVLPRINLAESDIDDLLGEIVDRSGLLLRIDGGERYQFAHLTLQEYLAAVAREDDLDGLLERFAHAPDDWREVVKLWCGAVDKDSGQLIATIYESDRVLALECLADAQVVDDRIADEITSYFWDWIIDPARAVPDAVIAALGMVAADPRPRGRQLYEFMVNTTPSDAVLAALAATKLPEAARALAASPAPAAWEMLLTMGDLAVPALTELASSQAHRDIVRALDALAHIGTAAAAVVLESLLWTETPVAAEAAWRLACLITDPEIESALSEHPPSGAGRSLPWVWTPFRAEFSPNFNSVVERIAYLLDIAEPDSEWPGRVDARLAIPLCVLGDGAALQRLGESVPDELRQKLVALRRGRLGRIGGALSSGDGATRGESPREALRERAAADADINEVATAINEWLEARWGLRPHRMLFRTLAFRLQLAIVLALWNVPENVAHWGRNLVSVRQQDWERVRGPEDRYVFRRSPAYFLMIAITILFYVAVTAGGILLCLHAWRFGPVWVGWTLVGCSLLYHALILVVYLLDKEDDVRFEGFFYVGFISAVLLFGQILEGSEYLGFGGLFVGNIVSFLLAVIVGQHYVGWLLGIGLVVLVCAAISALSWYGARRVRAASNPLRGLLELDELAAQARSSVIAT